MAHQELQQIANIYAVESDFRGQSAEHRRNQRQLGTRPVLKKNGRMAAGRTRPNLGLATHGASHGLQPEQLARIGSFPR